MKEIFRDIKGYEGIYQISNLGNVKRLEYKKYNKLTKTYSIYKERLKKQKINNGYMTVTLCKNSKNQIKYIHRLIAEAFIPNKNNCKVINHKDGNKLNNNINNLEWCTTEYNIQHAYKNKLMKNCKEIAKYDIKGNFIEKYNSINLASKKNKINQGNISMCALNKRKTAGGYIWKLIN